MDRETLSHYGWIAICCMIMAVMLAFATPLGNYVKDVAKDLNIGKNKAYELFKDENFPSINIGKTWQIAYIAYLKWKCDNNKKL